MVAKTRMSDTRRGGTKKGKMGFFRLVAERVRHFTELGKLKTASNYACALKHFRSFRQEEDIAVGDLTAGIIRDFQSYLIGRRLKMNTVSLYNRSLRAAYNYALDEEMIQVDRRPFRKVFTGLEKTRKRALKSPMVRRLIRLPLAESMLRFARDLFLFSVYMQGMPFVDLAHLTKAQFRNGCIVYQRRKTNRRLVIRVHACARRIIDRYRVKDPDCPYLFPILYNPAKRARVGYFSALRSYNKRLARLSLLLGQEEPLTSYVARHTWASLAREYGVRDTIICEAMGHSDIKTTMIYLNSLDTGVVAAANRKILTSLMTWRI